MISRAAHYMPTAADHFLLYPGARHTLLITGFGASLNMTIRVRFCGADAGNSPAG